MTKMTSEQFELHLMRVAENNVTVGDSVSAHAIDGCARAVRHYLIETDEQRRERFEAWFWWFLLRCENGKELAELDEAKRETARRKLFGRDEAGAYCEYGVDEVWTSWQAALTWRGETKGGET